MYLGGSTHDPGCVILCRCDTESAASCDDLAHWRVQRVCQSLLMCATTSPAQAGQTRCGAVDLARLGMAALPGAMRYGVTIWRTVEGSHAPPTHGRHR
jgi:hypothetical protein